MSVLRAEQIKFAAPNGMCTEILRVESVLQFSKRDHDRSCRLGHGCVSEKLANRVMVRFHFFRLAKRLVCKAANREQKNKESDWHVNRLGQSAQKLPARQFNLEREKGRWGDRRDSNPQQPESQSGALPLNYGHHKEAQLTVLYSERSSLRSNL